MGVWVCVCVCISVYVCVCVCMRVCVCECVWVDDACMKLDINVQRHTDKNKQAIQHISQTNCSCSACIPYNSVCESKRVIVNYAIA